jgi:uncharacterized membrane protein YeaQ/YmgE (transglycosylase-associated protein family)
VLDSRPRTTSPATTPARALVTDAAVIIGVLLLLAVVAGLLWVRLVEPVMFTRVKQGVVSDEVALARQFDDDGWYVVLATVAGAVAGAVLTWWRSRDPVATVLLLVVGAAAASWVMAQVGHAVGPPSPGQVLADARIGATAPGEVKVHAVAAYFVWPIAVLFGAVVVLWARRGSHPPG